MSASCQVSGQFDSLAALEKAVGELKRAGVADYEVYSPVALHPNLERQMPRRGSRVQVVATFGGIAGVTVGLAMCILASRIYDLITGGKPPVSVVPFVVIAYEMTILVAGLAAVGALVYYARLRPLAPPPEYSPRFSGDRYGVSVRCDPAHRADAIQLLQQAGATEVTELEGAGNG